MLTNLLHCNMLQALLQSNFQYLNEQYAPNTVPYLQPGRSKTASVTGDPAVLLFGVKVSQWAEPYAAPPSRANWSLLTLLTLALYPALELLLLLLLCCLLLRLPPKNELKGVLQELLLLGGVLLLLNT